MDVTPTLLEVGILVLSSIASGIVGYGVDEFLGPNAKARVRYYMRSLRKERRNKELDVKMAARYDLEESVPLEDFSDIVSSNLSQIEADQSRVKSTTSNPDGDRHTVVIETKRCDLELEVEVIAQPGGGATGHPGGNRFQAREATSIILHPEISAKYNNLRWALEMAAQRVENFEDVIPVEMERSSTYSLTCELETPTEIEKFLQKLEVDRLKVENDHIEADFDGEEVVVRNLSLGDRPDVFDKLEDLIIYYG